MRYLHRNNPEKLTTANMGNIVPLINYPLLPGDIVRHKTDVLLRTGALMSPAYSRVRNKVYVFAVPKRLCFSGFEDYRTGGKDGDDAQVWPYIESPASVGWAVGSLMDQLGFPTGVPAIRVDATIARAYNLIVNRYFLDPELDTQRVVSTAAGADTTTDLTIAQAAWARDILTSARPAPQSGSAVSIPLTGDSPVISTGSSFQMGNAGGMSTIDYQTATAGRLVPEGTPGTPTVGTALNWGTAGATTTGLEADNSGVTAIDLEDLRIASNMQRFKELIMNWGHTLPEFYRMFGIRPQDSRMQWPEYLASGGSTVQFSEVIQTAEGTDPVGELRGHAIGATRSARITYKVFEDSIMMVLQVTRPDAVYSNALRRDQTPPDSKFDLFHPAFQNLGMQAILNKEVDAGHATPNGVFGWANQNYWLTEIPSQVSGEFKPGESLEHYTQAREFLTDPALNSDFIECVPSDRIFADANDQLRIRAMHSIRRLSLLRPGPKPRLL